MLTKQQIADRIADAEKAAADYEARGEATKAAEFRAIADNWRSQLDAPGREPGEKQPASSGWFREKAAALAEWVKPEPQAAPIVLPEQRITGDASAWKVPGWLKPAAPAAAAPGDGVRAATLPLAAAVGLPGGVQQPQAPAGAVLLDAAGRAAKWVGLGLLGAGIGAVALRFVGGRR